MRLGDLQEKDIVNINDGKKVGRIIDAEVNETGVIEYLVIEEKRSFNSLFSKDSEITIRFKDIKKIGTDVILVDIML
ncbi:MAG: YlmC/YmxH family sporulation protein [bacterium]|nr:YlmC/YmxH family sporulation protein [bacterium]